MKDNGVKGGLNELVVFGCYYWLCLWHGRIIDETNEKGRE